MITKLERFIDKEWQECSLKEKIARSVVYTVGTATIATGMFYWLFCWNASKPINKTEINRPAAIRSVYSETPRPTQYSLKH